jgi:LysM repeat protein
MIKKTTTTISITLAIILAFGVVHSIKAQGMSGITESKPLALVVQATKTPTTAPQPTEEPLVVSTPMPDGTVKHIVGAGQSLWAIADAYQITIEYLLELNELEPDAIVVIGDELIISPPYTPTSTPIGEASSTPPPRYSHTPDSGTPQGTTKSFSPATPEPTETPKVEPRFQSSGKHPLVIVAAVVISGGSLAAALYYSLRRRE